MHIFLAATTVVGVSHDPWTLIINAGAMVKFVMIILALASVVCWAIMIAKYFVFRDASRYTELFLSHFYEGQSWDTIFKQIRLYHGAPIAHVFEAGYHEIEKSGDTFDNLVRALRRAMTAETTRLEKMIYFLATTGSTAPFIGLFGTVWGIMGSFQSIGATGVANLAVVAPGISEALIATAIGLAAAIPAVVAFNYFQSRVRVLESEMENFANDFTNMIRRRK
jgi:biopolymer transport protein TolQ